MDPTLIATAATVVVAIAAVGSAIAAKRYANLTHQLILEQRESQLNDKFPCISVRCRFDRRPTETDTGHEWTTRLVNVGRGPAFIDYFHTTGLGAYSRPDGDWTHDIDKVIGPDVGDPYLQVAFAQDAHPSVLRESGVTIIIRYHDIAGRVFESGIRQGEPFFEPPWQH